MPNQRLKLTWAASSVWRSAKVSEVAAAYLSRSAYEKRDRDMSKRKTQDAKLRNKRIQDHAKVLRFLMDTNNLKNLATGRLESPQKLVIFFAGYIAMRRMWEVKTRNGRMKTGDPELDKGKNDKSSIIYRIDKEVAHPLGYETSTLFKIIKFKFWGRKFLKACEK